MPTESSVFLRPSRVSALVADRWFDVPFGSLRGIATWGLIIAGTSCGAGLLASSAPSGSAVAVVILFFGAIGVGHVRRLAHRHSAMTQLYAPRVDIVAAPIAALREAGTEMVDADYRLARLAYYGGMILLGQLTFRTPKLHLTVSDWIFFFSLCLAIAVFCLRQRRMTVNLPPMLLVGTGLFAVGGLLSSFGSDVPNQSIAVIIRLCYLTVVWFWLGTIVLQRLEHIWLAVGLWIISASLDGAGAILQYFKGDVIPGGVVHWGRVTGFTQNVNDLGGVASAALVPALLILLFQMRRGRRGSVIFGSLAVGLIATGLILSGSVGSLLAACVAMAFWFGAHPTPVRRLLALAAVAAALLFFLSSHNPTYSQSAFDRIGRFGTGSPDDPHHTLDSRLEGYHIALVRIEANPFVGVGLDAESSQAGTVPVHNIIIGTLYETGVLGLIGLLLIFLSIARMGLTAIIAARDTSERALAIALVASFVAFLVFLLSEPALYTRYGWVSAALLVALRSVQTKRAEQEHRMELASAPSWRPPPLDDLRKRMLDSTDSRRRNRRIE